MKTRSYLPISILYVLVIASALTLALHRARAQNEQPSPAPSASPQTSPAPIKPRFTLSTNRAYGSDERARVFIGYQGVTSLDFRVYQITDPARFFRQLTDPHRMGEEEQDQIAEVAAAVEHKPSFLERVRSFKVSLNRTIKSYFRSQIKQESRVAFNDKFRSGEQLPLNAADFARVPLLNSDLVTLRGSWRQVLTPTASKYDARMVPLGKREPGVYLIEAVNGDRRAYTITVVTDLTMIYKSAASGEMLVYAVDRKSGEPRNDVQIEVFKQRKTLTQGTTDGNGIARLQMPKEKPAEEGEEAAPLEEMDGNQLLITARRKDQFAVSDLYNSYFGDSGESQRLARYIYTDRPVYRPKQKVFFKGILRRVNDSGGYETLTARTVTVTISDNNEGKLLERELPLTARGSFSGSVDLPDEAPLGGYSIVAKVGEAEARGFFEVAEYKKPEYKVRVAAAKQFVPVGETTKFNVEAKYFFGSPVANADVKYYIYRSRYHHWFFAGDGDEGDDGISDEGSEEEEGGAYGYGNDMVKEGTGRLDSSGNLEITFTVPEPEKDKPFDFVYRLEATVTDSSRREIDGKASFVGTRGTVVANAEVEQYVVYQNDNARIKVRTADYEGKPAAAKVQLKFIERKYERIEKEGDSKWDRYEYKLRERDLGSAEVMTNSQGQAFVDWRVPIVGSIQIKTVLRENGKEIESLGGYLYAADRNGVYADFAAMDSESIKLQPDKKSYKPGETAHVLAMLPTDGAHLLVTTELNSILTVRRIDAAGRAVMIDVPIDARYVPNVYLNVCYVRKGEMYTSDKLLSVPAADKFLKLEVVADKKTYKPRDPASYTVIARNADGSPASGVEVSLGVVDEAIYSIRPDTAGDMRREFYGRRYKSVDTSFSSSFNFTGYSDTKSFQLAQGRKRAYQLADFKNENQLVEPKIRKEFKDTAFWQPDVVTGADGKASVKFTLPDNLTTWRATARAVTSDLKVGASVGRVLSRKDLILRLETPRFMTEGDTITVSGIVHNYLDADKAAQVELQVTGAKIVEGGAQQTVTVTKNGEQRIDWRIAAEQVGNISLLATAKTNTESDGVELPLPVVPLGLKQTKGGAAALSQDEAEQTFDLNLPANTNTQARSLRIEAAPSIAGTMFGALDYLTSFPYGCTEQTMSSFLPNVIVAQVLKEVKTASLKDANKLGVKVQKGLDRLYALQHDDGGWGWWKDDKTDAFMTAYVVDGLALASRAGYGINNYALEQGRKQIRQLLDAGKIENKTIDPESRAYLVYALNVSGANAAATDARYVNDLFNRRTELQQYGRALLALALKARNDNRARQVVSELERAAKETDYEAYWESTRKTMLEYTENVTTEATALALKALAQINPQSELLPKAARWLVGHRRNGYFWESTRHTAFAIYGLTDYLKASRELSPDYTVEVFLNGELVLTKRVTAAEATAGQPFIIERKGAQLGGANQVRIVKRGAGVLYASATVDYFLKQENIAAQSSQGLQLSRDYLRLRVTDNNGKPQWTVEPLSGELRSGDMIVARLRVQGPRGQYLLVEDPIPAGCEQLERVGGVDLNYSDQKWSDWYSSREFRDQRTAIFKHTFDGDATFKYALRVLVPGDFKVSPARAEMMYQPTVQASTTNARLAILDKK